MSELDEAWAAGLAEAEARARAAGRRDIADYIALRSANDLIRKIASEWLLTMFSSLAGEANRAGAGIISTEDTHRFKVGTANMVGRRLSLERGVRKLFIEVGWPRTPRDGFIRGGGLACGNIKHLGIKSAGEELRLVVGQNGVPQWIVQGKRRSRTEIHEGDIQDHLAIFLDDPQSRTKRS